MNYARSDTYINVYLPREDGDDPRTFIQENSPVFSSEEIYKFSDEIVKDRKLFLGKKQTSLYEIYYKDSRDCFDSVENADIAPYKKETKVNRNHEHENKHKHRKNRGPDPFKFPRVSKLSISLDNKLRRAEGTQVTRFNEPASMYGTHRGINKYDPNQSIDRQVTAHAYMHMTNRRRITSDSIKTARVKTHTVSRLFNNAQSAPSEFRQVRSLGLPPISRSNTTMTDFVPGFTTDASRAPSAGKKVRLLRPTSKPHTIWQQTTNVYMQRYEPSTTITPRIKQMKLTSSRSRLNATATSVYV